MGLRLSEAKTQIVHMSEAFDFLGFRIQWKRKRGSATWHVYTFIADRPIRSLKAKIRALTYRTSQQNPSSVLIRLNQIMRGWASYFRHAVCKHTLGKLANFAWWRVIRWLRTLRRWRWKDVRKAFTTPDGRWKPITADRVELFNMGAVPVTRYRYRGNTIPSRWVPTTPDGRTVESPVPGNGHGGFGERPGETDQEQSRHRAPGRLNHGKRSAPIRGTDPQRGFRPGTINVCDARDQALTRHPEPTQTSSVCSGPGVNHTEVHREASPSPGQPGWTWHTSDQMEIRSDHHG